MDGPSQHQPTGKKVRKKSKTPLKKEGKEKNTKTSPSLSRPPPSSAPRDARQHQNSTQLSLTGIQETQCSAASRDNNHSAGLSSAPRGPHPLLHLSPPRRSAHTRHTTRALLTVPSGREGRLRGRHSGGNDPPFLIQWNHHTSTRRDGRGDEGRGTEWRVRLT